MYIADTEFLCVSLKLVSAHNGCLTTHNMYMIRTSQIVLFKTRPKYLYASRVTNRACNQQQRINIYIYIYTYVYTHIHMCIFLHLSV